MATKAQLEATIARMLAQQGQAPAAVAAPAQAAPVARSWKRAGSGVSKAGNPFTSFSTAMKNGGTFTTGIPDDLLNAIRTGKV